MMSACLRSRRILVRRQSAATLRPTSRGAALTAVILFIIGMAAAISVDVVRDAYDIKGDESTYVAMTLSLAHDGDLSYQRRDLERFWGIYKKGPEGIFLKRGKQFRVRLRASPPFVRVYNETPEPRSDRLYFAKAMIYAVAAAPFVRLLGMNGFLVFHVLLLARRVRLRLPVHRRHLAAIRGAGLHAGVCRRVGRSRLHRLSHVGSLQLRAGVHRLLPVAVQGSGALRRSAS